MFGSWRQQIHEIHAHGYLKEGVLFARPMLEAPAHSTSEHAAVDPTARRAGNRADNYLVCGNVRIPLLFRARTGIKRFNKIVEHARCIGARRNGAAEDKPDLEHVGSDQWSPYGEETIELLLGQVIGEGGWHGISPWTCLRTSKFCRVSTHTQACLAIRPGLVPTKARWACSDRFRSSRIPAPPDPRRGPDTAADLAGSFVSASSIFAGFNPLFYW